MSNVNIIYSVIFRKLQQTTRKIRNPSYSTKIFWAWWFIILHILYETLFHNARFFNSTSNSVDFSYNVIHHTPHLFVRCLIFYLNLASFRKIQEQAATKFRFLNRTPCILVHFLIRWKILSTICFRCKLETCLTSWMNF